MTFEEAFRRLNHCEYLYLVSYGFGERPTDLRVEVVQARVQDKVGQSSSEPEWLGELMGLPHPIEPDSRCDRFTIDFRDYIAISIVNESYAEAELTTEPRQGLFRTRERSHFRNYISGTTFATDDYPGPFKHFELVCLDHVLNVACPDDPIIVVGTAGKVVDRVVSGSPGDPWNAA